MDTIKIKSAFLPLLALGLTQCNNFIHDLIPRDGLPASYTVRFNKNGGTTAAIPVVKTVNPPAATIDALPAADPTWAGHAFEGWWTKNGSGGNWGAPFTASTPVTADIVVYAKWNPYYTVTFDKNNSDAGSTEASPNTQGVAAGSIVNPLPVAPARPSYFFVCWNTEGDGSGTVFTASTPVTANITVYAQWATSPPLKLVINGSSGTFTIPTNNAWTYDWTIDWGDGNIETKTETGAADTGISHTYTATPQYTIEITANSSTGHAAFGFGSGSTGANASANKQKLSKALGAN